jgi:hypothetical protein
MAHGTRQAAAERARTVATLIGSGKATVDQEGTC